VLAERPRRSARGSVQIEDEPYGEADEIDDEGDDTPLNERAPRGTATKEVRLRFRLGGRPLKVCTSAAASRIASHNAPCDTAKTCT
jgi:hypothetical protein